MHPLHVGIIKLWIIYEGTTVADSDTVNIRQLILIPTVTLGVLKPLHLLSRHTRFICEV